MLMLEHALHLCLYFTWPSRASLPFLFIGASRIVSYASEPQLWSSECFFSSVIQQHAKEKKLKVHCCKSNIIKHTCNPSTPEGTQKIQEFTQETVGNPRLQIVSQKVVDVTFINSNSLSPFIYGKEIKKINLYFPQLYSVQKVSEVFTVQLKLSSR